MRNDSSGAVHPRGFTLIESVLALTFAAVAGALSWHILQRQPSPHEARVSAAREHVLLLRNAIGAYRLDTGAAAPASLAALVSAGYLPDLPVDPWGNPYQYREPGRYSHREIWSRGPDGVDSDDDVVSWDLYNATGAAIRP